MSAAESEPVALGWWVISGDSLMEALTRAHAGEDPGLLYAEFFANADSEKVSAVEHRLEGSACSCGQWEAALGESIHRGFDRHLLESAVQGGGAVSAPDSAENDAGAVALGLRAPNHRERSLMEYAASQAVDEERASIAKELGRLDGPERLAWTEGFIRAYHLTLGERWDDSVAPGGWVCATCGMPVESEPCAEHTATRDLPPEGGCS